ncbi:UNVERIFIED_CONTAM: hypothetical protein ABID98_000180 [Brevibacillus sp. OAP136]
MTKLLSFIEKTTISGSTSPIEYKRGGYHQRYLTINGEEIANTGIDCETCLFLVDVSGAKITNPTIISNIMNEGLTELSHDFITELSCIIPNGQYVVALLRVYPRLKNQADGNEYYQIGSRQVDRGKKIEEYIVPIQPSESLDQSVILDYMNEMEGNKVPTVLSVSFLDIKFPLDDLSFDEIWLHTHFLLDGHHKILAAAKAKKPITMISFLSIDESFASLEQIGELIQALI